MNILLLSALTLVSAADFVEIPINGHALSLAIRGIDDTNITFTQTYQFINSLINGVPHLIHLEPEFGDLWVFEDQNNLSNLIPKGDLIQDGFAFKRDVGVYKSGKVQLHAATVDIPYTVINKELAKGILTTGGVGLGPKKSPTFNFPMPSGGERDAYPNLADQIKSSGYAQSSAFTINVKTSAPFGSGNLVYGAMDLSQFTGKLKALSKSPSTNFISAEFTINGNKANATFDHKNPNSYLDDEIVAAIARDLGAQFNQNYRLYTLSARPKDDLVLNFDGLEIRVPHSDLWVQDENLKWYFTIRPRSASTVATRGTFLGADILKSIYIVYDLEHDRAAIGQAVQNPGSPNYEVIPAEGIPQQFLS